MAPNVGPIRQPSFHKAAITIFLRPVFLTASRKFLSSQAFIVVRSIGFRSGKTACTAGKIGPLKALAATVVRTVGTLKILAAFASPVTLLMRDSVSIE